MKARMKDHFWHVTIIEIKSSKKGQQPQYTENTRVTGRYI